MAGITGKKVISILSLVVFALVIIMNAISTSRTNSAIFIKLFNNRTNADVSNQFHINITPAGYAFSIWGLLYSLQAAWLIFVTVIAFKVTSLFVLSYKYFAAFLFGCLLNFLWLVTFSHEELTAAFVVILMYWASLVAALSVSYIDIEASHFELQKQHPKGFLALRLLVQNGIAGITTWVTVATCLNLAIALVFSGGLSQTAGCSIALTVLTVIAVAYFVLENFIFANVLSYTFLPWPVLIWALVAVLVENYKASLPEAIFTVILTAVVCIFFVIRIVLLFVRPGNSWSRMQLV